MRTFWNEWGMVVASAMAGIFVMVGVVRCGDDDPAPTTTTGGGTRVQVERLGQPGINEALVVSPAYLAAFNSIGPSLDLSAAAAPVVTEAALVLRALFLGSCFVAGAVLGQTDPAAALKPGGYQCRTNPADTVSTSILGLDMFQGADFNNPLTTAAKSAGDAYAGKIAGEFLPDILRLDTAGASGFAAQFANAPSPGGQRLLKGGRLLTDDTIDIIYGYLLNGDPTAAVSPLRDGVQYALAGAPNSQQGHNVLRGSFPWAPKPL